MKVTLTLDENLLITPETVAEMMALREWSRREEAGQAAYVVAPLDADGIPPGRYQYQWAPWEIPKQAAAGDIVEFNKLKPRQP